MDGDNGNEGAVAVRQVAQVSDHCSFIKCAFCVQDQAVGSQITDHAFNHMIVLSIVHTGPRQ